MVTAIERLRRAQAAGEVTCARIAEESGLAVSTVHDLLRYPEVDMRVSTARKIAEAADALLGPDESELDPV
jgi:hypothetical protein